VRDRLWLGLLLLVVCIACAIAASAAEVSIGQSAAGAAWFHRAGQVAASNGRGFLTAWIDYRNSNGEIFAVRSALDGTPLDRVAFRVAKALPGRLINSISMASDGDGYVIAYTESQPFPQVVRFAHVDDRGVVVLRDLIPDAAYVSIAWSGTSYVAAYYDSSGNANAAVVARDGTVMRERVPLIGAGAWDLRVAGGSNGRVIGTWLTNNAAVVAAPIDSASLLAGKFAPFASISSLPTAFYAQPPVVASGNAGHLVAWVEVPAQAFVNVQITPIRARRLDANGNPIGNPFTIAESQSYVGSIAATWTGSSYVVAFVDQHTGRVRTVRVDDAGFTATDDLTSDVDDVEVALASMQHGDAFAVWSRETARRTIYGSTIGSAAHLLSVSTPAQSDPQMASCGNGFAAAWVESSDRQRVVVDRFGANGIRVHEGGASVAPSNNLQSLPAIACSADSALVAWSDSDIRADTHAFAQLVDLSDRSLKEPIALGAAMPGQRPAVIRAGNQYIVAWQSFETRQLMLARINDAGQLVDTRALRSSHDSSPSLAWNGSEILLTWIGEYSQAQGDFVISLQRAYFLRLTPELTPLGSITNLAITGIGDDARAPLAAAGAKAWLVVWRQRPNWTSPYSLQSAIIGRDGDLRSSQFLVNLPDDVAFDAGGFGDEFRVVFGKTMVHISAGGAELFENLLTPSDAAVAIAHGGAPLVIYSRLSDDESIPRLFIDAIPSPHRRAVR
jgi:hypothetical protein